MTRNKKKIISKQINPPIDPDYFDGKIKPDLSSLYHFHHNHQVGAAKWESFTMF